MVRVKLPVMACSRVSELLVDVEPLAAEYAAVMAWVPTLSDEVVNDAAPLAMVTGWPMATPSAEKVTVPVEDEDWTAAWKVTAAPEAVLVLDEVRVTAVG